MDFMSLHSNRQVRFYHLLFLKYICPIWDDKGTVIMWQLGKHCLCIILRERHMTMDSMPSWSILPGRVLCVQPTHSPRWRLLCHLEETNWVRRGTSNGWSHPRPRGPDSMSP